MPRFGADGMLKPAEIQQVADYVMTLYGDAAAGQGRVGGQEAVRRQLRASVTARQGRAIARRARRGWPRSVHLYGDDRATVVAQITTPRMGVMPAWNTRLDEATIKSLALYVHSLGGGE